MSKTKPYSDADMAEVLDNPEWTAEDFKRARPFAEVFPELAEKAIRRRGRQKAPTKALVSLRLDQDVLDKFRAGGSGWQGRINEMLRKAVGLK